MFKFELDKLTPKQREAWDMRYRYGWRIKKIALKLGRTSHGVSQLIMRAERRLGLPKRKVRVRMIRTKPRAVRAVSLSRVRQC